jgi:hypothetical protein
MKIKILILVSLLFFSCKSKKVTKSSTYEMRFYKGYYFQYYDPGAYGTIPYKKDSVTIVR